MNSTYPYQEIPLPYAYDALTPRISADTLTYHHDKHYKTYVDNLNRALEDYPELQQVPLKKLLTDIDSLPQAARMPICNNGGGVYNHQLYFSCLQGGSSSPEGFIRSAIEESFHSYEEFKEQFSKAALTQFGSGYAFLTVSGGKLAICQAANQDTPLPEGKTPILCVDVWEHAYYLDYQNKRADYISNWFQSVNWKQVDELYRECQTKA